MNDETTCNAATINDCVAAARQGLCVLRALTSLTDPSLLGWKCGLMCGSSSGVEDIALR